MNREQFQNQRLQPNFKLDEFLISSHATADEIREELDFTTLVNIRYVALKLQQVRDFIDNEIVVVSGFRPEFVNDIVGGVNNSHHLDGSAADIYSPGISSNKLASAIMDATPDHDELIPKENGGVHVAYL